MKIETILNEWDKDAEIDYDALDQELLRIPKIHAKYYRIYVDEKVKLTIAAQALGNPGAQR